MSKVCLVLRLILLKYTN